LNAGGENCSSIAEETAKPDEVPKPAYAGFSIASKNIQGRSHSSMEAAGCKSEHPSKEETIVKSNIDAVRQRKIELTAKNRGILDKAGSENRNLTEAESAEYEVTITQLKETEQMLIREERQLELERGMKPVRDGNRAAAERSGDHIIGTRGFSSLAEQLQAVVAAARTPHRIDPRLGQLGTFDRSGQFQASVATDGSLGEAVPSEGGFLVGTDWSERIFQRTYATGSILKRCIKQPISGNANGVKLRVIDEDSRADGSRMGGVLAFWMNEADTFLSSRPKFREIELRLNKLTALVFATDELLQDAAGLEAWIMNNLPTEIAFRVEDAVFNGSGAGQPNGILNALATIQAAVAGGESNHFPVAQDILNMWARFWAPGLENSIASIATENLTPVGEGGKTPAAAWFVDQSVLPGLFGLTLGSGTAAILLYHPPGYFGLPGPYGQMLGIPVIPTEHNQVAGTPGDMILADLTQYLLADKGAPLAAYSMHVRFLQDEGTFRFTYRVDGETTWKKPLTPKNGGPTLAPFVTLATR
jgi:HK97 family phage major capsid protein